MAKSTLGMRSFNIHQLARDDDQRAFSREFGCRRARSFWACREDDEIEQEPTDDGVDVEHLRVGELAEARCFGRAASVGRC